MGDEGNVGRGGGGEGRGRHNRGRDMRGREVLRAERVAESSELRGGGTELSVMQRGESGEAKAES